MQNDLRRVLFERSGGPLHLSVGGVVTFHDGTAEVLSSSGQGRRELTPEERQLFEKISHRKLDASASGRGSPGPPDRYQYDLVLEGADGQRTELRFYEEPASALNEKVPGLGDLAAWIRQEVATIWKEQSTR
jgi:hypothetical protein